MLCLRKSEKVTACLVLDDCDDNYETLANMVDGEVSLSVEPTKQTSSTPIAFNAVDTREGNILNIHTANDDDGPWSSGNEHKSDRNTGLKNGTFVVCRAETLYEILQNKSYHRQKQGTHRQTCAKFSLGHKKKHYGVDATIPVSQRKTDDARSSGQKRTPGKDRKCTSSERIPRFVARFKNSVVHLDWTKIHVFHDIVEGASNENSVSREVYGRERCEGD